jgi:hypothetical protein
MPGLFRPVAAAAQAVDTTAFAAAESRGGNLVVRHAPDAAPRARALLERVRAAPPLPALPADVLDRDPPIRIYLAPDERAFARLTRGRAPHWGAGIAFPATGEIVLPAYASPRGGQTSLDRVLRHELAHVALQRYLDGLRVPTWFAEGYATWAAGQFDLEAGWMLRLAFLTGRAPPLDSLALDWPDRAVDARVAYTLSASAVAWLHRRGGDRVMSVFLERWRDTGDFERALRATYGLTVGQLERHWGDGVRRRYGWLLFLAQTSVIWALLSALVLALFVIRRRRHRRGLRRLVEHEIPDDPAYWIETDTVDADPDLPPPGAPAPPRERPQGREGT